MNAYVEVAVPVGTRNTFAYSVPPDLRQRAVPGVRALVPFGRKYVTGFIVGGSSEPPAGGFDVRPIRDLLDASPLIPASLVHTALWIADYYFTPLGEVLKAVVPAGTQVSGARKARIKAETLKLVTGGLRPAGLDKQALRILETLASEGEELSEEQLSQLTGISGIPRRIDDLAAAGHLEVVLQIGRARVDAKEQLVISALRPQEGVATGMTSAQERLYDVLLGAGTPVLLQDALRAAGCTAGVAKALRAKGLAEIAPAAVERIPADLKDAGERKVVALTVQQQQALVELRRLIDARQPARCLLHGVTGSGKTEVYLRLIDQVLNLGGSALLLVPEIGLTPLLSRIAVSHFQERVSLLHSGMSPGERFDQWTRIRSGGPRVVVGTRSAVFAPLDDIRLIVIDEEQDGSYKQDEPPCYHAREVAWHRLRQSGGLLLLGSATPAIETYHAAQQGAMRRLLLPERISARPLPGVTVVDMGQEFQSTGKRAALSVALDEELRERVRKHEQCIILLNRRGYSRSLFCRSCGHVFTCPDCSVSMTYHQSEARLVCHYCGMEKQIPSACADCGGPYIYFVGIGTEQLEQVVRTVVPSARIARVDRDTTRRRGALRKMLFDFAAGDLDVLVGTQMLAKGHDFPNVTLVGVLAADADLAFPDFRSAERTFQLLTQVAGRAGRGATPGHVVIQCLYPDHYAIRFARRQDYEAFYRQEIEYRQAMGYPPFRSLAQVLVRNTDGVAAFQIAERVARALKHAISERPACGMHVLGPAPAPLEKLRGEYRVQLLIKAADPGITSAVLREAFEALARDKVPLKSVHVDVDPLSLL